MRVRNPPPWLVDAVLVGGGLFLTALAVKTPWSPLPRPVIALAGAAGSLALLARRRWPVSTAVAGAGAHALSGNPGPLLVGLFAGTERSSARWLPLLAAVGFAGFAAPELVADGYHGNILLAAALETAVVMAFGVYSATRHALIAALHERAARAEAERWLRDEQARAAERARIAREMHDVIAHKVALISLHAGALEVGAAGDHGRVEQGAALIRTTAHEALEELRSILGLLRSGAAEALGADAAGDAPDAYGDLEALVESWRAAGVTVTLADDAGALPAPTERAVYRLVQEGLTNAHKHAPGAAVTVSVTGGHGDEVVVSVTNPAGRPAGAGPAPPGAGVGLVGLDERLRTVGGTLHSGLDGAGVWRLEGRLPRTGDAGTGTGDGTGDGTVT